MSPQFKTQLRIWGISVLFSVFALIIGDQYGKANDCRPDQIDGQCGLSTDVGLIYGILAGILVLICATFYSIYRNRRDSRNN
jgi:hypothetical protein